ncbi:alternate F1F0 ATPase, F1 subunit alpha [Tumidithrix elongata RA019]|uniref:ATP synthase subunit alpha n=1 Tax=Tumidithrix elongata BACA0141 TaxID=2716417 RepID=A0AAW9Q9U0_9CYAN|nr:alternate F1F0 ATPase, F1 subunit alpha [Tumidithrix elongata RA019]
MDNLLQTIFNETLSLYDRVLSTHPPDLRSQEIGIVQSIGQGIAKVTGLPHVESEEIVRFAGGTLGMVFNLDPEEVGIILLDASDRLRAGFEVRRTGKVLEVPVGDTILGRVIDPLGRPLDGKGAIRTSQRRPAERNAPAIMDRAPVNVPLQTGIKAIDALIPIGRGQRELILGDRQTGKSALAIDTIVNQKDKNVLCIYCAIGQRSTAVAKLIADLEEYGAMDYTTVVMAGGEEPPGLQFVAPYAATTMAEYFMEQGRDVLIIYDDLTTHARAYRELSLLLRRPPGREAFPGDIFYIHSRLLERSTHLHPDLGGGSLTALPILETEAQNMAAYIPTNLISITDGQIYLSPGLFQKGVLPAIDVGKSVSRVGGKTQLPAYRSVAGALRLSYSQFEELEAFSRFGTRLEESTRLALERGRRVREVLKQPQYKPMPVATQIAILLAVTEGLLDAIPIGQIGACETAIAQVVAAQLPDLCDRIERGEALSASDRASLLRVARDRLSNSNNNSETGGTP